jgi:hypothetical protein
MELLRLRASLALSDEIASFVSEQGPLVVIECIDADTVILAGSLKDQWTSPLGVWLHASPQYPAQLIARDVATLSWIVELRHVVVSASENVESHADVVRVLLSDAEVNFSNDVVNLVGAYNRPAPPGTLRVWSYERGILRDGETTLLGSEPVTTSLGELTSFVGD